jgi:hypothetical protein
MEPTQVVHPWKAAIRTGIQSFLAVAGIAVLALPLVQEFVAQFWPDSPVIGFIGLAATFIGGLALLVSRIMAIPGVNDALTQIGLGAQPKR